MYVCKCICFYVWVYVYICDRETSMKKYEPTDKLFQRDGSERAAANDFPKESFSLRKTALPKCRVRQ